MPYIISCVRYFADAAAVKGRTEEVKGRTEFPGVAAPGAAQALRGVQRQ